MTDHFDVGISDTPRQVYILSYHGFSESGILCVVDNRDKAEQEWKKYLHNPRLINEFVGESELEYWVDQDPDDAIEVWDVK